MISLKKAKINSTLTVDKVIGSAYTVQRLLALGIYPQAEIKILIKGSVYILAIKRSRIAISQDVAQQIFVEP